MSKAMLLPAGDLRHRITIQTHTETRDAIGGVVKTWISSSKRWGSIRPLSGQELVSAKQVDPKVSHKIVIRYQEGLTTDQRLLNNSRVFNISSILNIQERDKLMVILAKESV